MSAPAARRVRERPAPYTGPYTGRPALRVLLDTNVLLDVLLARQPWAADAERVLDALRSGPVRGGVAAHTVTTLYYIAARTMGRAPAWQALGDLLGVVDVVAVDAAVLAEALTLPMRDFEDAVQAVCARRYGADLIVTRDPRDFAAVGIPVTSPAAALTRL